MICDKGIKEKQFKNIILRALARKHNTSVKLFFLQMINQIISQGKSGIYINYSEIALFDKSREYFKKYYKIQNNINLKKSIYNYLGNRNEVIHPKIYADKMYDVMNRYFRTKVQYAKWQYEMKKSNQRGYIDSGDTKYRKQLAPLKLENAQLKYHSKEIIEDQSINLNLDQKDSKNLILQKSIKKNQYGEYEVNGSSKLDSFQQFNHVFDQNVSEICDRNQTQKSGNSYLVYENIVENLDYPNVLPESTQRSLTKKTDQTKPKPRLQDINLKLNLGSEVSYKPKLKLDDQTISTILSIKTSMQMKENGNRSTNSHRNIGNELYLKDFSKKAYDCVRKDTILEKTQSKDYQKIKNRLSEVKAASTVSTSAQKTNIKPDKTSYNSKSNSKQKPSKNTISNNFLRAQISNCKKKEGPLLRKNLSNINKMSETIKKEHQEYSNSSGMKDVQGPLSARHQKKKSEPIFKRLDTTPMIMNKINTEKTHNSAIKHKHVPSTINLNLLTSKDMLINERSHSSRQRGPLSGCMTERQKPSRKSQILNEVKNSAKSTRNLHKRSKTGNNNNISLIGKTNSNTNLHAKESKIESIKEYSTVKNSTQHSAIKNIDIFKDKFKQQIYNKRDEPTLTCNTDRSYGNGTSQQIKESPYTDGKMIKYNRDTVNSIFEKDKYIKHPISSMTGRFSLSNAMVSTKKSENKITFGNNNYGLTRGWSHGLITNNIKTNSSYSKISKESNLLLYTSKKDSTKKLFDRRYHTRMKSDIPSNKLSSNFGGSKTTRSHVESSHEKNQKFGSKYVSMKKKNQRENSSINNKQNIFSKGS